MRNLAKLLQGAKLHLSLSEAGAHLAYAPSSWRPQTIPLFETAAFDRLALTETLAPVLGGRRYAGLPLSVTVSDEWVRLFMVAPPKNALGMQDVRTAAAMRFQTLYGDNPAAWRIVCDNAVDRRFLACAMPASLLAQVQAMSKVFGIRLVALVPDFVATWNRVHRRLGRAWVGVVQEETMTVGCVEAAPAPALAAVHRLHLPADYDDEHWLADQVRGIALRHGLANPQDLKLFGRYVPGLGASSEEDGLAVAWPELPLDDRPVRAALVNLAGIDGARA